MTEKELGDLIRAKDPSVVFIAETWMDETRLKKIKRNLQFDHMFFVPQIHKGGGLVLYWKEAKKLTIEMSSKDHTFYGLLYQSPSLTTYGHLVDEVKELAKNFSNFEFGHVLRQGNSSVHNIARHARHVNEFTVWMENVPPHPVSVIQANSTPFE